MRDWDEAASDLLFLFFFIFIFINHVPEGMKMKMKKKRKNGNRHGRAAVSTPLSGGTEINDWPAPGIHALLASRPFHLDACHYEESPLHRLRRPDHARRGRDADRAAAQNRPQ
jgi:hypothetical protein